MNSIRNFICLFCVWTVNLSALIMTPLSTEGNQIVSNEGQPVRLQGISWFGFETPALSPQGLHIRSYQSMMDQMKSFGFNTIRLPFSNQLFDAESIPNGIDITVNPDLKGLSGIEILDKIIQYAEEIGLWIILDHHRNAAGTGLNENGLWYSDDYSESRFLEDWGRLAERYLHQTAVIGAELHSELHGEATWGSGDARTDWQAAAEAVGNAVLRVNPNWLIIVGGIETYQDVDYWPGSNLMGVKNHPILLDYPEKLVYSAHEFPKSVHAKPWLEDPNYPHCLPELIQNAWGYLLETNTAPVLIGEFGSPFKNQEDEQWLNTLMTYMNSHENADGKGISWVWWAWNPNVDERGGILQDDWQKPDESAITHLQPLMTEK